MDNITELGGGGTAWSSDTTANPNIKLQQSTLSLDPIKYRWLLSADEGGDHVTPDYKYHLPSNTYMPPCGQSDSIGFFNTVTAASPTCSTAPSTITVSPWGDCANVNLSCDTNFSLPAQYSFSMSGITSGSCGSCSSYNATFTLTRNTGTCVWADSAATPCGTNTYTGWRSRLEYTDVSGWNVRIFNGNKTLAVYGYHPLPPVNEHQRISTSGDPSSGTYTLSLDGSTTSSILLSASPTTIKTRIEDDLTRQVIVQCDDDGLRDGDVLVIFEGEDEKEEVQRISITGTNVSGTFTVTFESQTTSAITWPPGPGEMKSALEALSNTGSGSLTVSNDLGSGDNKITYDITFRSSTFLGRNVDEMTIDTTGLTGVSSESVTTTTEGHTPNVDTMTITPSFDQGSASVSVVQGGTYGPPNPWSAMGSNVMVREYVDDSVCNDFPDSITVSAV